jgi:hypothetical protein
MSAVEHISNGFEWLCDAILSIIVLEQAKQRYALFTCCSVLASCQMIFQFSKSINYFY